jgi:hypothetical protein
MKPRKPGEGSGLRGLSLGAATAYGMYLRLHNTGGFYIDLP